MLLYQQNNEETTNRAIASIFSLDNKLSDQKSVLLKRGPIKLRDSSRDLMLFTRGFVVANVDFRKIAKDSFKEESELQGADGKLSTFEMKSFVR